MIGCTISSRSHCLIFWILDFKIILKLWKYFILPRNGAKLFLKVLTRRYTNATYIFMFEINWRAPKSRGETHWRVSQSQVAEKWLSGMLPASNSRKG
jgi:hypothetical protein